MRHVHLHLVVVPRPERPELLARGRGAVREPAAAHGPRRVGTVELALALRRGKRGGECDASTSSEMIAGYKRVMREIGVEGWCYQTIRLCAAFEDLPLSRFFAASVSRMASASAFFCSFFVSARRFGSLPHGSRHTECGSVAKQVLQQRRRLIRMRKCLKCLRPRAAPTRVHSHTHTQTSSLARERAHTHSHLHTGTPFYLLHALAVAWVVAGERRGHGRRKALTAQLGSLLRRDFGGGGGGGGGNRVGLSSRGPVFFVSYRRTETPAKVRCSDRCQHGQREEL